MIVSFNFNRGLPTDKTSINLNFMAFYWVTGLMYTIISALYGQTRVITRRTASPEVFVEIVEKYQVSNCFAHPYLLHHLINFDGMKPLKSIRHFSCGGSTVS
jgi:acyl-coenzyme A synthetase/AMP-(fatty) acid ligase